MGIITLGITKSIMPDKYRRQLRRMRYVEHSQAACWYYTQLSVQVGFIIESQQHLNGIIRTRQVGDTGVIKKNEVYVEAACWQLSVQVGFIMESQPHLNGIIRTRQVGDRGVIKKNEVYVEAACWYHTYLSVQVGFRMESLRHDS